MVATRAGVEFGSETYSGESETHRFEYDRDVTSPSMAVVAALSRVKDVDPIDLEPLQATVDTDALNVLISRRDATGRDLRVTVTHGPHVVTVDGSGEITVTPSGSDRTDLGRDE